MESLLKQYSDQVEQLKQDIQASELLQTYLESEEDEDFLAIREQFEPMMHELYRTVATDHPMQIPSLEKMLMDPEFEGLYLPKLLGYSVLRGAINDDYKFNRPQESFKNVLLAISQCSNFDLIKLRIGQSIQIAFGLCSDIWTTNFINSLPAKGVRTFLNSQKLKKYNNANVRNVALNRYKRQFAEDIYYTAEFPTTKSELSVFYPELESFIVSRIRKKLGSENLWMPLEKFAKNDAFWGTREFTYVIGLALNYFELNDSTKKAIKSALDKNRADYPKFESLYFEFLRDMLTSTLEVDAVCHRRVGSITERTREDDFTKFYNLMDVIDDKGWIHQDSIEAVRDFYYQHEGLSTINECVRHTIYKFFEKIVNNLNPNQYLELFEIFKQTAPYVTVFDNEHFNQDIKNLIISFVKKFRKVYTDKRSREYQDVKKWMTATFIDFGFMSDKELKEFFKTKRKPKAAQPK